MVLSELYGSTANAKAFEKRVAAISAKFQEAFGSEPTDWFSSSGRAEIVGNHTDHNHGKVIVAAIGCDILAAVKKRDDDAVIVHSMGFAPSKVSLRDLNERKADYGKSVALVRGVCKAIAERGYSFGGFEAVTESTVFRGAGVSSSAAFEVLVAQIVNQLYLGGALDAIDLASVSQYAENVHFGKPCGLLDQTGIAQGGINKVDFCDPSKPVVEHLLPPKGYSLVITNTGGSHAQLTGHYAAIKEEMLAVAAALGVSVLREAPYEKFFEAIPQLRKTLSDRAILRAFHFYEENDRVDAAAKALKEGDTSGFLAAVSASGASSLRCLQNCFVPGSVEQPISLAVHMSERIIRDGAVRVHGGGFAGTILAYLADGEVPGYVAQMQKVFGEQNVFATSVRLPGAVRISPAELLQ